MKILKNSLLVLLAVVIGVFVAAFIGVSIEDKVIPGKLVNQIILENVTPSTEVKFMSTEEKEKNDEALAKISEEKNTENKDTNINENTTENVAENSINEVSKEEDLDENEVFVVSSDFEELIIDEGLVYRGETVDGQPHGLGYVYMNRSSFNGIVMYGEFNFGEPILEKSKVYDPDNPYEEYNMLGPDITFNLGNGLVVNRKELGEDVVYIDWIKQDGITKIFSDEVLKRSIEKTDIIYIGKMKNNLVNKKGKIYYRLDQDLYYLSYEGEFNDGYMDGDGIDYYGNQQIAYEGEFSKGKFDGDGIEYYFDGSIEYDGGWKNGEYDGKGTLYYSNGQIEYEGKWNAKLVGGTERKGNGKSYYKDGTLKYDGDWDKDTYNGKGTLYDENGKEIYKGEFKDGDPK